MSFSHVKPHMFLFGHKQEVLFAIISLYAIDVMHCVYVCINNAIVILFIGDNVFKHIPVFMCIRVIGTIDESIPFSVHFCMSAKLGRFEYLTLARKTDSCSCRL